MYMNSVFLVSVATSSDELVPEAVDNGKPHLSAVDLDKQLTDYRVCDIRYRFSICNYCIHMLQIIIFNIQLVGNIQS